MCERALQTIIDFVGMRQIKENWDKAIIKIRKFTFIFQPIDSSFTPSESEQPSSSLKNSSDGIHEHFVSVPTSLYPQKLSHLNGATSFQETKQV